MLENIAATSDTLLRIFAILAAICAVVYLFSSRQLQRTSRAANERAKLEGERQVSDLQTRNSNTQTKLEQLQNENARLAAGLQKEQELRIQTQRRFGPRLIGPEKTAAITELLSPFAGQKVNFAYFAELETASFAERIIEILKGAGWKPQVFKLKAMQPVYGVACGGPDPNDNALRALTQALELLDKHTVVRDSVASVLGQPLQQQASDQVWVIVGLKRPHVRQQPADSSAESDQEHAAVDRD
jgi:hypothetical protein